MKTTPGSLVVNGRPLTLSNLDKVLYPANGFTKAQVIDYYARIAPLLLPHLKNRPLTLKRYPNGVRADFFYEKNCPAHRPPWVKTAPVPGRHNSTVNYCLINDTATLLWVANLASLELHTLLSRVPHLERPTAMVFDLDPGPGASLLDCVEVALQFKEILHHLDLQAAVKTSGGKGLHVYVPLNIPIRFEQTKLLSRTLAELLERQAPKQITTNMRKDLRPGRVFVDWSQNDRHKTTVSVYSLRAMETPVVSVPLRWEELQRARRRGDPELLRFEPGEVLKRARSSGDLFESVLSLKQALPKRGLFSGLAL